MCMCMYVCFLTQLSLSGSLTRRERLCFLGSDCVPRLDDAWRSHLGPAASLNHTDASPPPAETLIFSPWGGWKCKLKLHFLRVFLCRTSPFLKIPKQRVNLRWHSQLWRGGKLLKQNTVANVMLLCAQMVPCCYNAICLWLAAIERDNHPLSRGKMPCSNYVFCSISKKVAISHKCHLIIFKCGYLCSHS